MKEKKLKPVIGLEIHIELDTKSKIFCGCSAYHFREKPNSQTCPVCLGLPGALPVTNKKAIEWAIMIGLALNCKVAKESKFDRKHYFYPDLPKGFQISQYDKPLCVSGYLDMDYGKVRITRVHIEEETGKLIHKKLDGEDVSLVDFNRSGVPLVEIVTEPDLRSAEQTIELAQHIQKIVRKLKVSTGDMEKGSMRLEANISWGLELGYKVEIKNVNSFKFTQKAIDFELARQKKLLDKGKAPKQETRGWDEKKQVTVPQRWKETAADYRYFPEPDIPPMRFSDEYVKQIEKQLPKLPEDDLKKLVSLGLNKEDAVNIAGDEEKVHFVNKLARETKKANLDLSKLFKAFISRRADAQWKTPEELVKVYQQRKKRVTDKDKLSGWIDRAIKTNPKALADFQQGKEGAISVFIGAVMQFSSGKADPKVAKKLLEAELKKPS